MCSARLSGLVPLLCMAAALVWRVPFVGDLHRIFEGREPLICWSTGRADKYSCLNALTGEVTQREKKSIDALGFALSGTERVYLKAERYIPGRCEGEATIIDSQTRQILRKIPFDLPSFPTILNRRYAVCTDAAQITALDLDDAEPQPFHLAAPLAGRWTWVSDVPGKSRLWRINDRTTTARAQVEVFEIADHRIQRLFTWPVGTLGHRAGEAEDCLLCVTPDNRHIERRSLESGQNVQTLELPVGFDPNTSSLAFIDGLFWTSDGVHDPEYYDAIEHEQLRLPDGRLHLAASSPDRRLRLFFDYSGGIFSSRAVLYDMAADVVRFDLELAGDYCIPHFLPDHRLALASSSYGVSSYLIDPDTGQVTHRQIPYAWVAYTIPLLVFGFLIWALVWMRASARAGLWAWCDIALLGGIAMLPMLLRLLAVGSPTDVSRQPFHYCHGVFLGLFQISTAWLIFGKTRLTLRYIPIVLTLAALVLALNFVMATTNRTAGVVLEGLAVNLIPAVAMAALAGMLRLAGWRWCQLDQRDNSPVPFGGRTTMRDPFIAITCFAIAAAAMRPLLPYLFRYQVNGLPLDILATLVACTFAGLIFALTARPLMFRVGTAVFVLLSIAIVTHPTYDFVTGREFMLSPNTAMTNFRVIATATLVTYILALAYRFRGWRLARRAGRPAAASSAVSAVKS